MRQDILPHFYVFLCRFLFIFDFKQEFQKTRQKFWALDYDNFHDAFLRSYSAA